MNANRPGPTSTGRFPDPWAPVVERLAGILAERLQPLGSRVAPSGLLLQIDRPSSEEADLAFPVHRFAKAAGLPPPQLAQRLAEAFPLPDELASATALAGFVNFAARPAWLVGETLERALAADGSFGRWPPTGRTVCVEHTSANPTGPFHIGRVRNAIIGDTFARVLRSAGEEITTQYYVDDVGRQAAMITWIWSRPPTAWPAELQAAVPGTDPPDLAGPHPDLTLGRPYPAASSYLKEHPAAAEEVSELSRRLERGEAPPQHRAFIEAVLRGMVASLARIGVRFDEFVWESSFLQDGSVEEVVARLKAGPHARVEPNGAAVVDATSYGLPKDDPAVVITRGDGTSLYVTRDVAYHLAKFRRFERVVDVLGENHLLHARTLEALLAEMGETRRPEFLMYQYITLPDGGGMSTRKGSAVYLDDLLDEAVQRARKEVERRRNDLPKEEIDRIAVGVGTAAVRYHILRVAPEKSVVFRWEDALSFEGRSGPFLQYAYARASSLLRKGGAADGPWAYRPEELADAATLAHLRVLSRLPKTVAYVARTGHVHTLAAYAHELADAFHRFYERVPVLSAEAERESRLAVVAATRAGLARLLELMGLEPLDAM